MFTDYEIDEYNKCKKSLPYFFYNYIYLNGSIVSILPQQNALLPILDNLEDIGSIGLQLPRAIGTTTAAIVKALHTALFNKDQNIFYIHGHGLMYRYKTILSNILQRLPNFLKFYNNLTTNSIVKFDNQSKIDFRSHAGNLLGFKNNLIIIDSADIDIDRLIYQYDSIILYLDSVYSYKLKNIPIKQYKFNDIV